MSCHHHADIMLFPFFGDYGVILTLFLTGFIGSFAHCIYMCGPIALGITNMRMIACQKHSLTEIERFKIALCLPYYFGKAMTYTLLAFISVMIAQKVSEIAVMRVLSIILLFLFALAFLMIGISGGVNFGISLPSGVTKFFSKITKGSSYGLKGMLQGMVLGLIPCGLVISSIATAIAYSQTYYILGLSMLAFGLATLPALVIVSYGGNYFQGKLKGKIFRFLFATIMFFNAYLLVRYALKLF